MPCRDHQQIDTNYTHTLTHTHAHTHTNSSMERQRQIEVEIGVENVVKGSSKIQETLSASSSTLFIANYICSSPRVKGTVSPVT